MKLGDARQAYQDLSGKASELTRQLAFAGLALVWIFKSGESERTSVPASLRLPSLLMMVALSLDFLQYVVSSAIWGLFARSQERELNLEEDPDIYAPRWFNWPAIFCFWTKAAALAAGYVLLLRFLSSLLVK